MWRAYQTFVQYVVEFLRLFWNRMHIRPFLLLGFLTVSVLAYSQSYVSPKKASTGVTIAIEINDNKDLDFVKNNLRRFYGVQRVRVNGAVDIQQVAATLELLDDLQDVQLLQYSGELTEQTLLKLEWVDNLTLFLRNGKEDQVLMNDNLGTLNGLTLIFEVVPEDYYFLDGLKKLRSLHLIAPFVAKEALVAVNQVAKLPQLRDFGISLDKIGDLPESIRNYPALQSLTVIDNLSWILEKKLENLAVLRKNIEYQHGGKTKSILFQYLATETDLYSWDIKHLQTVFPSSRFAPLMNASGDTSDIALFADYTPLKKHAAPAFQNFYSYKYLLPEFKDGEFQFQVNSEENAVLYLGKDAAVLVPKHAMRSNVDSVFHGFYTLKCSWFNQPGEYFSHAFNLNFDSSKRQYELAPSGVLEVSAASGNEKLDLRNGYFMKFVFSEKQDTAKRFYARNTKAGKWENYYDYDYRFDDANLAAVDFYNFYAGKKTAKEYFGSDKSNITWRFENEGYYYLLEPGQGRVSLENYGGYWVAPVTDRAAKPGSYTLKRGKALIGLKKEYVDKAKEEGIVKFQIFDKTQSLFPELKAFENYAFDIETALSPKDFSAYFIRGMVYSDVRIEQIGTSFVMDLRTDAGIWRLNILKPADKFKGQPAKAKAAQNEFMRRYNKYKSSRAAKETAFNNYINSTQTGNTTATRSALFYPVKGKGTEVESFRIRSMGVFIWGKPIQQIDTFALIVKFTDAGGIPLDVKRVFVAHLGPYAYRTFGAEETYSCIIDPKKLAYLACIDHKDRVFILTGVDFRMRHVKNNSFIYLAMNEFPRGVKNMRELEKVLGINK